MGLIAYYNDTALGWNLTLIIGAFENYTINTEYAYVDGYIRVWQDATGGTYVGSDVYIDIPARVRQDGWLMAWLPRSANYSYALYWGFNHKGWMTSASPVANATSMARALQRVYASASRTWVGYNVISYYDFQYSSASRLVWAGRYYTHTALTSDLTVSETFYVTLNNLTIKHDEFCWLYYVTGVREWLVNPWFTFQPKIDSAPIYTKSGNFTGTQDLVNCVSCPFVLDPAIRHTINLYCYQTFDGNSHACYTTFWYMFWL
jgi:hypothetical protein